MKTSPAGIDFITKHEGVVLHPYKDSGGKWTIGIGHLITTNDNFGSSITLQQAKDLLAHDLVRFEDAVNSGVRVELKQNEFDALVSFSFNVGDGAFLKSTLLKVLNQGNYAEVPNQLRRWNKVNGKTDAGLVNRREAEVRLWES